MMASKALLSGDAATAEHPGLTGLAGFFRCGLALLRAHWQPAPEEEAGR